ncbi:hypothetical protein AC625_11940 [Peribacillus loiseleuriae]|uniref:Uncharacterized protein n=1 Tax=Peribacillus loiseleuriae TaxID=1679170 RepID=A0A0K9GU30_9BACI|nr:hypothetical protein AC625_11940 [Peribacillus loiseleuriae]
MDIAQEVHVARAVNFRGIIVGDPLSFNNNEVGMEPTDHYWINLSKWPYEQDIEVVTVNPHLVKRNKENRENSQSKRDKRMDLIALIKCNL